MAEDRKAWHVASHKESDTTWWLNNNKIFPAGAAWRTQQKKDASQATLQNGAVVSLSVCLRDEVSEWDRWPPPAILQSIWDDILYWFHFPMLHCSARIPEANTSSDVRPRTPEGPRTPQEGGPWSKEREGHSLALRASPSWDFPRSPVVKTALPKQRAWVLSLVGELRFHTPYGQNKWKMKKRASPSYSAEFNQLLSTQVLAHARRQLNSKRTQSKGIRSLSVAPGEASAHHTAGIRTLVARLGKYAWGWPYTLAGDHSVPNQGGGIFLEAGSSEEVGVGVLRFPPWHFQGSIICRVKGSYRSHS